MKKLSGFSLMEMMVVLLITAVVAAATAPIVSKKMVSNAGSGESPWMWVGTKRSIVYNVDGNVNKVANIGGLTSDKVRLFIQTDGKIPQIAFKGAGSAVMRLLASGGSIRFTDSNKTENLPSYSIAIGDRAVAGASSVAIGSTVSGPSATSAESLSVAMGFSAVSKNSSTALGAFSSATSANSTAIGANARTTGGTATAIGSNSIANEDGLALGYKSDAGIRSLAVGAGSNATGTDALAIGYGAKAMKAGCVGITTGGSSYGAIGSNSTAFGYKAKASGDNSVAIGSGSTGSADDSTVIGYKAKGDTLSTALGSSAKAAGGWSTALGSYATADVGSSTAIGYNAVGFKYSTALGSSANAGGSYSTALGSSANAAGSYSTALGYDSNAKGMYNTAIGYNASTNPGAGSPYYATAIGYNTKAFHEKSTAIGYGATTTTKNQIVLGDADTTVYIPGKLVVDKGTVLGRREGITYFRFGEDSDHQWNTLKMMLYNNGVLDGGAQQGQRHSVVSDYFYNDEYTPSGNGYSTTIKARHNNGTTYTSDRRLKNVGDAFKGGLAELKKLELFNFTFKKDPNKTPMVGVIAQDLQKVFPNAVMKGDDGFLRIRWDEMFFSMINAIKELDIRVFNNSKKIEALEKQNTELQKKIDKLEQRLDKLEKKCK